MPSESMAELPVIAAAMNFVTAIRVLPIRAATIIFLDDEAILYRRPMFLLDQYTGGGVTDMLLVEKRAH